MVRKKRRVEIGREGAGASNLGDSTAAELLIAAGSMEVGQGGKRRQAKLRCDIRRERDSTIARCKYGPRINRAEYAVCVAGVCVQCLLLCMWCTGDGGNDTGWA